MHQYFISYLRFIQWKEPLKTVDLSGNLSVQLINDIMHPRTTASTAVHLVYGASRDQLTWHNGLFGDNNAIKQSHCSQHLGSLWIVLPLPLWHLASLQLQVTSALVLLIIALLQKENDTGRGSFFTINAMMFHVKPVMGWGVIQTQIQSRISCFTEHGET